MLTATSLRNLGTWRITRRFMSAGVCVARFGMKLAATPRTRAIVSAEIAAKLLGPVSSHFSPSRRARSASVAKRYTRPRSPCAAETLCATIAQRAEAWYSVESWAGTASIRFTRAHSMSPRCFIRRSRFSREINRNGSRCPRALPYSRRCRGSDRLERSYGTGRSMRHRTIGRSWNKWRVS